jgi:spermidine synthase
MAAHLPALIGERPHSVLVTGFAAGVTAGTLGIYPGIQKIVISEPERLLLAAGPYFQTENKNIVDDPRVAVVNQNARQYLRSSDETFDVITSDAFNPWINSALFTREYFELCKKHLSRGGVIAQWLPLYESGFETVKTELATFFSVFPNATIWSNTGGAEARDLILIGQASASPIDLDRLQERLELSDYAAVAQSLSAAGFHSAAELLATYTGRASDLNGWLGHTPVNLDTNLRLQYAAAVGLDSMEYPNIYRELLAYRRFPADLMIGSNLRVQLMRSLLRSAGK